MKVVFILSLILSLNCGEEVNISEENKKCVLLLRQPSFEPELALEHRWIIYYTWKANYKDNCFEIQFKNVTPEVTKRIWTDMEDYLEQHPPWEAAVLRMKSHVPPMEMLLFTDEGPVGKMTAIDNVVRSNQMVPAKKSIPLTYLALKFLKNGKYLLKLNCKTGVAHLMLRDIETVDLKEMEEVAQTLDFLGPGNHTCGKKYWLPYKGGILVSSNQTL